MKAFKFLTLSMVLLAGCTAPKKQVIVIRENTFFRCEPSNAVEKKMVRLINNARAGERKCGFKRCAPVPPVRWDSKLAKAALNHSIDMAKNDILSHTGSNGSVLNERLEGVG